MSDLAEVIDTQATIIRMQSDVINDICKVIMQHISAEEADAMPCIKKINMIAELRQTIK